MEELKNVIKTLFHIQNQIKVLTETLNVNYKSENIHPDVKYGSLPNYSINFQNSITAILSNYHIILLNSFLDEYHKHFNDKYLGIEFEEAIKELKKRNGNYMKRINVWTDIKSYRNHIAAHNFRNNNKSLFSISNEIPSYKIPNTISKKNLVCGILELMCRNIIEAFPAICYHLNPNEIMLDWFKINSENVDVQLELNFLLDRN